MQFFLAKGLDESGAQAAFHNDQQVQSKSSTKELEDAYFL